MLSRKPEVGLVSQRFSLHQQMLATSGTLAFPRLGSLPFQTPRVCFMTTTRCIFIYVSFYWFIICQFPNAGGFCDLLQYLGKAEYLKGIDVYVSIIKAYASYESKSGSRDEL